MKKSIKSRVFDEMHPGQVYTRQDIVKIYQLVSGNFRHCNGLSTSLCTPNGTQGYFCWPTEKEPRYIRRVSRNQYKLVDFRKEVSASSRRNSPYSPRTLVLMTLGY